MNDESAKRAVTPLTDGEWLRAAGVLAEVNRRVLHPLGLALEFTGYSAETGAALFRIWDDRDDPGGIHYGGDITPEVLGERQEAFAILWNERWQARGEELGYMVQPVPDPVPLLS
jgi:hypothetical protein